MLDVFCEKVSVRCFYFAEKIQSVRTKTLEKQLKVSGIKFLYVRYKYKECRIKSSGRVLCVYLNILLFPHDLGKYT